MYDYISNTGAKNLPICDGSYSCYNSTMHFEFTQSTMECNGLHSCANVSLLLDNSLYNDTQAKIYFRGEMSFDTSILNITNVKQIRCDGFSSCANSIITLIHDVDEINFYGYLSGYNSTIYCNSRNNSDSDSNTKIKFVGTGSGYATIICTYTDSDSGSDCSNFEIICQGDACNNLSLKCLSNDGNYNYSGIDCFNINCDQAEKSDICINGYQVSKFLSQYGYDASNIVLSIGIKN